MCSQYTLKVSLGDLYELFQIANDEQLDENYENPSRVLPYTKAPVLVYSNNKRKLEWMQFSLVPSWSKEAKNKFATHNARLESVDEKPTFRVPFVRQHCIIPMTGFVEAIYLNELAGNMVEFHPPEPKVLYAAGIWDEWVNKNTGELLRSFSIITSEPIPFVDKVGHDRSPLFLNGPAAVNWLKMENEKAPNLKGFLVKNRLEVPLSISVDRPMRPGWEKRIPH